MELEKLFCEIDDFCLIFEEAFHFYCYCISKAAKTKKESIMFK